MQEPCTCLVVADHRLCGQAVGGLLSEQCGLELLAVSASLREALRIMENVSTPGLLLLDVVQIEGRWQDAAEALQRLNPDGRLILLKDKNDGFVPPDGIGAILLGVVEKSCSWQSLIDLVIQWQQSHQSPALRRHAAALLRLQGLAPRERKVFSCLGKGLQNKEIAKSLGICVNTVETYRKSISAKLGLSGVELVRAAVLQRCANLKSE